MKTITIIFTGLLLIYNPLLAQKQALDLTNITKVEIYYIYGDIKISGTNGQIMEVNLMNKRKVPESFMSLKFELKESNSDLDLYIETIGNTVKIYPASIQAKLSDYVFTLPKDLDVKINSAGGDKNKTWSPYKYKSLLTGEIIVSDIIGDIQINGSNYTSLNLVNISGPIVAESNSGDIKIEFSSLSQANPSYVKTNSGIIRISLPPSAKCDVYASSLTGRFRSDVNLSKINVESPDPEVRSKMVVNNEEADTKTSGQLNGGGVQLNIRSLTGDIYLASN